VQRSYGSRIHLFDSTPEGIVCPHFYELRWARGCPLDCDWCYLQLTLRIQGKKPEKYPLEEVERSLDLFFRKVEEPHLLNSGEIGDSLMFPDLMEKIVDKFEAQNRHKLLILSKLALPPYTDFLFRKPRRQTIVSFSINATQVSERYERAAPPPQRRILVAAELKRLGYEVRVRIDPIIPLDSSYTIYKELLDLLFSHFTPDRITLGSLRVFPSLKSFCKNSSWFTFLDLGKRHRDGRFRVGDEQRFKAYCEIMQYCNSYNFKEVSLCKETVEMWEKLRSIGLTPKENKCNCQL
jgi:spore photoproduct lyase